MISKVFSDDLKRRAVKAFEERGDKGIEVIAAQFGCSQGSLYYWQQKFAKEAEAEDPNDRTGYAFKSVPERTRARPVVSEADSEEEELRRENEQLKSEVSALRKTLVLFARPR